MKCKGLTLIAGAALLTACASTPPAPSEQMVAARTAVDIAAENGAREQAPLAFERAEDKLAAAKSAVEAGNTVEARRLAREAELDARYADRLTRSARLKRSIDELEASIEALRMELNREGTQ